MSPDDNPTDHQNPAVDLIRQKLENLYAEEPSAKEEVVEAREQQTPRSKHQAYILELSNSGKSAGEVQDAWHAYYKDLSDQEKHQLWQEFYANHGKVSAANTPIIGTFPSHSVRYKRPRVSSRPLASSPSSPTIAAQPKPPQTTKLKRKFETRSVSQVKQQLLSAVSSRQKLQARHHARSLLFGLGVGSLFMLILLFGFFNERFVAPFITPSRFVSSTPIIIDDNIDLTTDKQAKVIIPKINVEIPVVYDEASIEEKPIQKALERGVIHYATTPSPGEKGNVVVFGHSSNNIFNKGQYKFAFVLLSRLDSGDTFYLTKDGKKYAYKIYEKKIVSPSAVEVLGPTEKTASATLITCDPPGTSLNRLVVIGEQISPDPSVNTLSTAAEPSQKPQIVPSNAQSLWNRLTDWL